MAHLVPSPIPVPTDTFAAAYDAVREEIEALDSAELRFARLDVISAVTTVLGVLPRIAPYRETIASELPTFDLDRFDRLRDYALAAAHAHAAHLVATEPSDGLAATREEGFRLRGLLHRDALALSNRGWIPRTPLAELRGGNGSLNLARDLRMLVSLLEHDWASIRGKCGTTEAELLRGAEIVGSLLHTVGRRWRRRPGVSETGDRRIRAITLLVRAYEGARRALHYLRWEEGDADDLAPSLFAARRKRGKTRRKQVEPEVARVNSPILPDAAAGSDVA